MSSHDPVSYPRASFTPPSPAGCDACRARKVRCARDNPDDSQSSCKHCITLGIPCTYDYQPKKRGPPNLYDIAASLTCSSFDPRPCARHRHRYLRRLQEAAAAAAAQHQLECQNGEATSPLSARPMASPRQSATVPIPNIGQNTSTFLEQSLNNVGQTLSSGTLQSSRFPITADAYQAHYQQMTSSSFNGTSVDTQRSPKTDDSQSFLPSPEQFSTYPLYNWSYRQHQPAPAPTPNTLPPLSYYYRAHSLKGMSLPGTLLC